MSIYAKRMIEDDNNNFVTCFLYLMLKLSNKVIIICKKTTSNLESPLVSVKTLVRMIDVRAQKNSKEIDNHLSKKKNSILK